MTKPQDAARQRRAPRVRGLGRARRAAEPLSGSIRDFAARYPFSLDQFQLSAIRALDAGRSVLAAAPTGTGKTVLAEFGIHLAREQGLRTIYTSPIKALSNQKFRDWRAIFGSEVGLLTGDVTENPGGSILVMTTEVLRNMLLQSTHTLDGVACVVFDEVHFLADPERGTTWEEAIIHCPKHVQLVCLSATVANAAEIASWISLVHRETILVSHFQRAVPLEHYYYVDGQPHLLVDAAGDVLERLRVGGEARHPRPAGIPADARPRGVPRPQDVVRDLEHAGMLPAIYFLFSRRTCELQATDCAALDLFGDREARRARRERIDAYLALLEPEDRELEQVQRLSALLARGIAFHHAGVLPMLKGLVEELFAAGLIGV
ncbi:MAG: DEAD/DEAH box helicase, partial [Chloroflexota bacterium]|nr:DEAD/DEAH box helicase [Chloroflexota bacterium]